MYKNVSFGNLKKRNVDEKGLIVRLTTPTFGIFIV